MNRPLTWLDSVSGLRGYVTNLSMIAGSSMRTCILSLRRLNVTCERCPLCGLDLPFAQSSGTSACGRTRMSPRLGAGPLSPRRPVLQLAREQHHVTERGGLDNRFRLSDHVFVSAPSPLCSSACFSAPLAPARAAAAAAGAHPCGRFARPPLRPPRSLVLSTDLRVSSAGLAWADVPFARHAAHFAGWDQA